MPFVDVTFSSPNDFNGAALVVNYPAQSQKYNASGTPVVSGAVVRMSVTQVGISTKIKLLLDASADSGIASLAGVAWPGTTDFGLSNK